MKSINAKRIAAVAASLLMGLAFAGQGGVTWSNIPIINNQGQPVVQVVVGSTAAPSDGVVAANIAAVIGNLAFTSENVTATPSGLSNVHCVVTTPTCTLTNQQVWFGERGFSGPSGSYSFTALIGSVLNGGVQLGSPSSTKNPTASSNYAFPETYPVALQISPVSSPFNSQSGAPQVRTVVSGNNGGGMSFTSFTNSSMDNLLEVTPAQLSALANNWGPNGETENLWITGFPVYDQQLNSKPSQTLAVFDVGGAYQVKFNKPIVEPYYTAGNTVNNDALMLLGKNWTIIGVDTANESLGLMTSPNVGSANAVSGGKLQLAASLSPLQTVYVGHNITSNNFSVELTDLGQPNNSGTSPAAVDVFYRGNLTNVTQLKSPSLTKFQVGTHSLFVKVNQTFAGLYAYQKWAKLKLYSNTVNITSGQVFNQTNAPGWKAFLYWTNGTSSGTVPNQLESIVLYNSSPVTLTPGQSFSFVAPNFTAYKVNFVGDTLGTNYDPVQFSTSTQSGLWVQNLGTTGGGKGSPVITNLTNQPAQELTITSQIPNAFSFAGQVSSSATYDLTPYELISPAGSTLPTTVLPANVVVSSTDSDTNTIVNTAPVTLTITGYPSNSATSTTTTSVDLYQLPSANTNTLKLSQPFYNITNMYLSSALPDIKAVVTDGGTTIATYEPVGTPEVLYMLAGKPYWQLSNSALTYNQQNGQPSIANGFSVTAKTISDTAGSPPGAQQYFTVNVPEYNVPGSTSFQDALSFGIVNSSTGGAQNFYFQLNQSVGSGTVPGTRNNMTYVSSQGQSVSAPVGFMTERGSKVASISPSSVTIDYAKAVDTLQFVVSPQSTVVNATTTSKTVGPVGVGQSVPGFSNLTVSAVNATCAFSSTSCSVSGLANVTATPSVSQAVVPVSLNTATNPLVVLDSNANSAATLILVGSKYVNSVSAQVFAQNPNLNSSFGPGSVIVQAYGTNRVLVAGYTANQTVSAGNQFINDLLQAASST